MEKLTLTSRNSYSYKETVTGKTINPPHHYPTRKNTERQRVQSLMNEFIRQMKVEILKDAGLFTKEEILWVVKAYLEQEGSHKCLRPLIENCRELRAAEYRKKFHIPPSRITAKTPIKE